MLPWFMPLVLSDLSNFMYSFKVQFNHTCRMYIYRVFRKNHDCFPFTDKIKPGLLGNRGLVTSGKKVIFTPSIAYKDDYIIKRVTRYFSMYASPAESIYGLIVCHPQLLLLILKCTCFLKRLSSRCSKNKQ